MYLDVIPKDIYCTVKSFPFPPTTINSIVHILAILSLPHTPICTKSFPKKLAMSSFFYDSTAIHDKDFITVLDGGQSMSYSQGCATLGCLKE